MENNFILQINNVGKSYQDKVALKDFDLNIPKGSIYGLLGPNGAGKTTLIRIINQIIEKDSGEIFFKDEKLNSKHISKIGYLPEERGLYKKVSVIDQLLYLGQLRGMSSKNAKDKALFWLAEMELFKEKSKKIEELSKGMQQKVQFIATVLHQPELLILDEPFSGFDPVNAELLTQKILFLNQEGCTILYSTHRMESVEDLCNYFALINQAEKVLDGSIQDIKTQFKTGLYIVITSSKLNSLNGYFEIENEIILKNQEIKYSLKIKPENTQKAIQNIISQTNLIYFSEQIPSIKDIFIKKVNNKI